MKPISRNKSTFLTCLVFLAAMLMAASISNVALYAAGADAPKNYPPMLQYQMGHTYVYQWHSDLSARYHTTAVVDHETGATESATEENRSRFECMARVTAVDESSPGEYLMALQVMEPRFFYLDENQVEIEETDPILNEELERPVFFKQNSEGLVTEFHYFPDEDESSLNIKKGIISALQVHLCDDTGGQIITGAPQTDASGVYTPRYLCTDGGDSLNITMIRDINDYTQFVNGEDPLTLANCVSINENVVKDFNKLEGILVHGNMESHIISKGVEDEDPLEDGASMWSESHSTSILMFNGMEPNPEPLSMDGYAMSSLIAVDTVDVDEDAGIETILAQLEVNPYAQSPYDRLVDALVGNPARVKEIRSAFLAGSITPHMHHAVIGALGALGTPEAQEIIIQEIILKPGISRTSKSQGVVALGLMKHPTEGTISILEMLSREKQNPLSRQAALMLGAAAENLARTNPGRAAIIIKSLELSLISAQDEQEMDLYLGALGNAGFDSSLDVIGIYLDDPSPLVRYGAVDALRKISAPEAEEYLRRVLATETKEAVKKLARKIYRQKTSSDEDISRPMSGNTKSWSKKIGKGDVYGKVYAYLTANNNGGNDDFYIYGKAEAKAYAWSWNWSLAKAEAWSDDVYLSGGTYYRKFYAKAYVLGSQVASYNYNLACGQTKEGTLWEGSKTFFNVSYSFYPYGIKVTVGVKASGYVKLKYKYRFIACSTNFQVEATATAYGGVTASGSASVSVYVAKAGVTLSVYIVKTTVPGLVKAIGDTSPASFTINFKLVLTMESLSGSLKLWAKVRKFWGGWRTVYSTTLWSFSGYAYTTTIFNLWYYY
ncbi:MAG: hypothetical protein GTO45_09750 [Candidatus Aminicenantes bacterium]|nr:hypothetical protein [Candidatus Aminicenantes bacterium]NIM79099.1 hypothetical protein [Candidatus Aminicenantes bacterium]NIN18378.1 hypothetical protein [Candidatus Aminicenantes bacterium]NIN42265.1 hypothetical protein [Candidatus Aminicenantes bacterium]NIN85031.1 hypothetical protein [Candidatus Aminicenantes bacterium]